MKDLEKQLKKVFAETEKSEWSLVKFGDIVREVKETCSNPESEGLERVVGLEHLTPLDIHIRDWKSVSDGTTFTRVFRRGQVLFGRRRAYQRKAVLAEFDGLCSGDIIVMEAIEGRLDPNLLPFIVHSDKFHDWAVSTSAGSLSPRTKFKHLAELEFCLPEIAIQQKISKLLKQIDLYKENLIVLKESIKALLDIEIAELIWSGNLPEQPLASISKLEKKLQDGDWIESKDMSPSGIRLLQLADIGENVFINKSQKYISEETFKRLNCFEVLPGDLLLARMPDPIGRTCEVSDISERMITAVDCCVIRVDENNNDKRFFLYLLNSDTMREKILRLASGSTRQRISTSNLKKISVPKPDREIQKEIADKLDVIRDSFSKTESLISDVGNLNASLLRKIV